MNIEKTQITCAEKGDGSASLLLVAFEPEAEAKETLYFSHTSGLHARVFVGKNDEPIAIRFRGCRSRSSNAELPSNPLELSKLFAKTINRIYGLATFLIELARNHELIALGASILEDSSDDDESDDQINLSDDVASTTERILSQVPRDIAEPCAA